jgi:hypothetical protein
MTANAIDVKSSAAWPNCSLVPNAPTSRFSSEPVVIIATAAIVGLAMRLVQRADVRHAPMPASQAEASVAAAGPCIRSSRKMKISPAANEFFDRGMRTGNKPASMVMATPITTWMTPCRGNWPTL